MRTVSAKLPSVLQGGGFDHEFVADLWYDGARRLANVPIQNPSFTDDDSRAVKSQGSCTVVWTDDFGVSISPNEIDDVFAPFGSELAVYMMVRVGSQFEERIPLGWFQIVDVPTMRDHTMFWGGRYITTGTVLELQLMDRLVQVQRDPFDVPTAAPAGATVWGEVKAISGLQIVRSIPDITINRAVAYQESRIEALLDLADVISGIPYMTPDGALSMRTKAWGAVVDRMTRGTDGTIQEIGKGVGSDGVYNRVAFRGQGETQGQILAVSAIRSGPLRVTNPDGTRSPAHRRTTFRSNQFVYTPDQAKAYTDSELVRVSTLNAIKWPIIETFHPARETGDVVEVEDEQGVISKCRIVAIARDGGPTQKVTVVRG